MLPFGVTIPVTVPQRSEIPDGLMSYSVYCGLLSYDTWRVRYKIQVFRDVTPFRPTGTDVSKDRTAFISRLKLGLENKCNKTLRSVSKNSPVDMA